ncbi:MAG: hypothetical protein PHF33_01990 [Candidatus Delongbacteria bacterium]|jgi:tetratricopeptide (TPR) repeat protein|nr:hypothetical protein [Candidatus Delongbacteria bacterium]MDD4205327.1 hypothetical protein [Candidatus Delongbacteria bacterium]MDY0017824.1 hypothetical protein [Candidatus Delongbacteria bacterium]
MKKMIEMLMVLAIAASVSAAGDAAKSEVKKAEGTHAQAKGHVCYNSIAFQADALEKQGKDAEAIKMLEDAKANAEYEHHYQLLFPSLVKLYEKTGQYEKSVELWNEGHAKNMTFGLDPQKEEFKPYIKLVSFRKAVTKDRELAKAKAVPQLKKEDCEGEEEKEMKVEKKEIKKDIKEKR